jgi:hypothetical protein
MPPLPPLVTQLLFLVQHAHIIAETRELKGVTLDADSLGNISSYWPTELVNIA